MRRIYNVSETPSSDVSHTRLMVSDKNFVALVITTKGRLNPRSMKDLVSVVRTLTVT